MSGVGGLAGYPFEVRAEVDRVRQVVATLHAELPRWGLVVWTAGNVSQRVSVPGSPDLFVIKPQFSGFYSTNLPVLLPKLGATRLILTGVAADICVLFTAGDAHMREYDLWVPSDAVASVNPERTRWALEIMEKSMNAEVRPTAELSLDDWLGAGK